MGKKNWQNRRTRVRTRTYIDVCARPGTPCGRQLFARRPYRPVGSPGARARGLSQGRRSGLDLMLVDIFMPRMRGFDSSTSALRRFPWLQCRDAPLPTSARRRRTCCARHSNMVPRAACASRSRRRRCWRSLKNVLPKPGPVSAASSSRTSGARIFAAAGDRLFDGSMRRSPPSAIGDVAGPGPGACVDKTLFTINHIEEGFLGFRIRTDQRVNLWVALQDQCGTVAQ
jgi:hypothetical protein